MTLFLKIKLYKEWLKWGHFGKYSKEMDLIAKFKINKKGKSKTPLKSNIIE